MAFPTKQELQEALPADGEPLTLTDIETVRTRWINSLEFQPVDTPVTAEEKRVEAIAEEVVREGVLATLERDQLLASVGHGGIPADIYTRISSARTLRKEYNDMRVVVIFDNPGDLA